MVKKTKTEGNNKKQVADWKDVKGEEGDVLPELPDEETPSLVLTGWVYQKLSYWRRLADGNEISCFGISRSVDDPLRVVELYMPRQEVTRGSTDMTAEGLAQMWDDMTGAGLEPEQFNRIWIHTHPGDTNPSRIDFDTCKEVFGRCDWFIMMIMGKEDFGCWLYKMGRIPTRTMLEVKVDYSSPGLPPDTLKKWENTISNMVTVEKPIMVIRDFMGKGMGDDPRVLGIVGKIRTIRGKIDELTTRCYECRRKRDVKEGDAMTECAMCNTRRSLVGLYMELDTLKG